MEMPQHKTGWKNKIEIFMEANTIINRSVTIKLSIKWHNFSLNNLTYIPFSTMHLGNSGGICRSQFKIRSLVY